MDLSSLPFTPRTIRCLTEAGFTTVQDVLDVGFVGLQGHRGLGRKSQNEVVEVLHEAGIDLTVLRPVARGLVQAMVEDERSEFCFDTSADDPEAPYYWEIDHAHIIKVAEALGITLPLNKQD